MAVHFPGEAGLAGSPSVFFLHLFGMITFGKQFFMKRIAFLQSPNQECQSTEGNSKHWSRPRPEKITHWTRPSLIHCQTREGQSITPFTPAVWGQYF